MLQFLQQVRRRDISEDRIVGSMVYWCFEQSQDFLTAAAADHIMFVENIAWENWNCKNSNLIRINMKNITKKINERRNKKFQ